MTGTTVLTAGTLSILVKGRPFTGVTSTTELLIIKPNDFTVNEIFNLELDEIEEAVTNECIIVSRINGELAGFLFYEKSGRKSVLRYWFVNPKFRNMNVGSSLIRHYLSKSCPDTSSQLWVVTDNYGALSKYQYYGYEKDVLSDQILMRK
jgi:hypothetical protein